jgi:hypothetical protein
MMILCWHAERVMVDVEVAVQQTELGDDPAALVREQREPYAFCFSKVPQYLGWIVTDSDQSDSIATKLAEDLLQLDQLRLAVGSPTSASVKDHERPSAGPPRIQ